MPASAAKPPTVMLDPLPDQLDPGVPYTVDEAIKADPGDLFAYVCAVCYGPDVLRLKDVFGISRQTLWIWRRHGKGVPRIYEPKLSKLLASRTEPFRLPLNAEMEDLLRHEARTETVSRELKQNHALLDLLHRIVASPDFGPTTLLLLTDQMARPVKNPYVFYRWAWAMGGVPRTYLPSFVTALMQFQVYALYDYAEGNRVQWADWAERVLAAPEADGSPVPPQENDETEDMAEQVAQLLNAGGRHARIVRDEDDEDEIGVAAAMREGAPARTD